MFTCSKKYSDLPFAHRQHLHRGHCSLIHGHNWGFEFTFAAAERDANGFVIDFGNLKWLKEWLGEQFDHTLVLNQDDPMLEKLRDFLQGGTTDPDLIGSPGYPLLADIRVVPNCGAEGLALFVFEEVDRMLHSRTADRVFLASVKVLEDEKNAATFAPVIHVCNPSHE